MGGATAPSSVLGKDKMLGKAPGVPVGLHVLPARLQAKEPPLFLLQPAWGFFGDKYSVMDNPSPLLEKAIKENSESAGCRACPKLVGGKPARNTARCTAAAPFTQKFWAAEAFAEAKDPINCQQNRCLSPFCL